MLDFIFIVIACVIIIGLNLAGTKTVLDSRTLSQHKTRLYIVLIWLIPLLGVMVSMLLLSREMNKLKGNNDEALVSALNDFTDKVKVIQKEVKDRRKK